MLIESAVILGGLLLAAKVGGAGQSAANSAARSVKRGVRRVAEDVADKAETVLQPCAAGRAPHKRASAGETYSDGTTAYFCRVCGRTLE